MELVSRDPDVPRDNDIETVQIEFSLSGVDVGEEAALFLCILLVLPRVLYVLEFHFLGAFGGGGLVILLSGISPSI